MRQADVQIGSDYRTKVCDRLTVVTVVRGAGKRGGSREQYECVTRDKHTRVYRTAAKLRPLVDQPKAARPVVWYAVYESDDAKGYDADYQPCESKEAAIREATGYLSFASAPQDVVYVVAVPESMCVTDDEEWSLWDCLGEIEADPASEFIYIHRGRGRLSEGQGADIVSDLRSLADDQDDTLGRLLKRAANEIERLRGTKKK